jgi:hypothetical protein
MLRTQLGSLTLAQDRYMNGTTTPVYLKFAKDKGFTPESITLPSGTQAHWFGSSSVKKVLVYFHGMSCYARAMAYTDFQQAADMSGRVVKVTTSGFTTYQSPSVPTYLS